MSSELIKASHAMTPEDVAEYEARIEAVRANMRQRGLDAVVVGDHPYGLEDGFRYSAYLSGFGLKWPLYHSIVVVPVEGQVTLVVSPGPGGGVAAKAAERTWITNIVSTVATTAEEKARTFFGLLGAAYDEDVVAALRQSGLERGRIGTIGAWPGIEATREALPQARFEVADAVLKDVALTINSAYEETQLAYCQRAAESTMRTLMETAQPGVLYSEVFAAMWHQLLDLECNAYPLFSVMSGEGTPWWPFDDRYTLPDARIRAGDLIGGELPVSHRGWHVQFCRTWVVGDQPTASQRHLLDGLRSVQEVMHENLREGITGDAMWKITLDACERFDFEPIARSGHWIGYWSAGDLGKDLGDQRDGQFQDTTLQFMPNNPKTVEDGMAVVIHPTLVHRPTNRFGILGDTGIFRNGRLEYLTAPREDW
ncbi:M24 family metallopeptidase [Nocardioides sp. LHD-245]|uniref:M24 family metallopeptidase n=1 Tax=Nocardioides sp. LHD-245 TaxID=3051387 RepID=UPI0027DF14D1|nr:M24 family metallopeptidase [Nocardioides sp. LHD-245]